MTSAEFERLRNQAKADPMPALYAALASAQAEFPDIARNRKAVVRMKAGGQYSYNYADLSDVLSAVRPILAANGLALMQWPDGNFIATTLTHSGGGSVSARWPIKPMPQRGIDDAQSFQSAVQVAKRYAATALLGISTEETVEGDPKAAGRRETKLDDRFHDGDGIRYPVGANVSKDMEPRAIAEEYARAISEQFKAPKTTVGLEGAWRRNGMFIERLRDKYSDLFDNVYESFTAAEAMFDEEKEANE